jgi:hypothetical protein
MYRFLWTHLPGPTAVRIAVALIVVLLVGLALWYWVFPAINDWLPFDDVTVG